MMVSYSTENDRRAGDRVRFLLPVSLLGAGLLLLGAVQPAAEGQLRIVSYNVAGLDGNQLELQKVFEALNEDPAPITGVVRAPDVYILQELQSTGDLITTLGWINDAAPADVLYAAATFTSGKGTLHNGLIYRTDSIFEESGAHVDLTAHAGPRETDRWKLRLSGQLQWIVWVYGSHFATGDDPSGQSQRADEAELIRTDADLLGEGAYLIYAGDWNVYSPSEPAFTTFFDAGPGRAVDPRFARQFPTISHTQSPHDGSAGLITGGMDDRFDFQIMSEEFQNGSGIEVVASTYRAFGNDGAHFNLAINQGTNSYFLPDEQWKADALAKASDHLPVVVDYLIPGNPMVLSTSSLVAGFNATLGVSGAQANENVYFVYSTAGIGDTYVSQLDVNLRLRNPVLAGQARANGQGEASLSVRVPGNATGLNVWLQAAQFRRKSDPVYKKVQ